MKAPGRVHGRTPIVLSAIIVGDWEEPSGESRIIELRDGKARPLQENEMRSGLEMTARKWVAVLFLYGIGYLLVIASFLTSDRTELKSQWITHDLIELGSSPKTAALFFIAALVFIAIGYAILLRWALTADAMAASLGRVRVFVLSLMVLFMSLPPFLSADVFNYYQQGWVVAEVGANPYVTPPGVYGDYPAQDVTRGANAFGRNPYGPIWTHVERFTVEASGGSLWIGILLFKVYATIASVVIALLASAIARQLEPSLGTRALVALGANPLLLIEGPGMGHNDVIALAVVMLAIWLQMRAIDKKWVGLTFLGLAFLIKVTVAPAILVFVHWLLRAQESFSETSLTLVKAAVPVILVLIVTGAPFVSRVQDILLLFGFSTLDPGYEIALTPVNFVSAILADRFASAGVEISAGGVKAVVMAVFLGLGAITILRILSRSRTWESHVGTLGPIYLIVTVVLSNWRPWYVLWPLSLVMLGPWSKWTVVIIVYSLLAVGTNVITRSTGIFCGCI